MRDTVVFRFVHRRTLASVSLCVAMYAASPIAQAPSTLAEVGGERITVAEFQALLQTIRSANQTDATLQTLTTVGRERLLNAVVDRTLYAAAAREERLDQRPDVRFLVQQAANEVLARKYLEDKARAVAVDDAALREFFDSHRDLFVTPSRVKVRQIVTATMAEAESVLAALKAGGDFGALATTSSLDAGTNQGGGDLGWVTRGVMVKAFEDVVFALKTGEVGGPVRTGLGFHVVTVDAVDAPALADFDAIKPLVRERKVATDMDRLRAALTSRHPVTVRREALASLGR